MKRVLLLVASLMAALIPVLGSTSSTASAAEGCSLQPTNGAVSRFLFKFPDVGYYRLTVPPGLSGDVPLLIDLHGGGGNAVFYEYLTKWPDYAMRKQSFILAAPDSEVYGVWNFQQGSIDVRFIKAVVNQLSTKYCIDPNRIYVSGHSMGGIMTDRMACDATDLFAAAAPYAGASSTLLGSPCNPTRPIPIAFFHGDRDTQAPIGFQERNRDTWVAREHCAGPVRTLDVYGYTDVYAPCDGGSEIHWRILEGQNHAWPTGEKGEDMRDRMWAFFNAHPKP